MNDEQIIASDQSTSHLKLQIADIIIEARCANPDIRLRTLPAYRHFLVEDGQSDCVIDVHYSPLPKIELEQQLFGDAHGPWALYSHGNKLVFQLLAGSHGQSYVHRLAIFEPEFDQGEIFICPEYNWLFPDPMPPDKERIPLNPFPSPLCELLVINLLAQERGVHMHASGVVYEGRGLVFCGVSGAGKSTLADLWENRDVKRLGDDRIALRRRDECIWSYGTPWHSNDRLSLPENAPLAAIYFIEHGQENRIVPLSITEVAMRLMIHCFPTFYLRQGMEYTLSFISELAQEVPCYDLQFTPDQRAVDELLSHVESNKV